MVTLTRSSSKIFIDKYRDAVGVGVVVGGNINKDVVARSHILSFSKCGSGSRVAGVNFRNSSFMHRKTILPIVPPVSATSDGSQASETAVDGKDQLSTVRVRFQLQKACGFGDHFLMVGDDPLFGSWDPLNAIPLEWSDGHVWTVEVAIPIGKAIQFKFILKQSTGDIIWQPGPDRVFKTWNTDKTITVVEDWENSELQRVTEDGVPGHNEELNLQTDEEIQQIAGARDTRTIETLERIVAKDTSGAAENITVSEESAMKNAKVSALAAENGSSPRKESAIGMMVADNIVSDNVRCNSAEGLEDEDILGDPVLVPGLAPMSNQSTDEACSANKAKKGDLNGSIRSQISKEQTATESCSNLKAEPAEESATLEMMKLQLQKEQNIEFLSRQENLRSKSTERQEPVSALKQESSTPKSTEEPATHEMLKLELQEEQQLDFFSRQENLKSESTERQELGSTLKQETLKTESNEEQKDDLSPKCEEKAKMEFIDEIAFDIPYVHEAEYQEDTVMRDCYRVWKNIMHWGRKSLQNILAGFRSF